MGCAGGSRPSFPETQACGAQRGSRRAQSAQTGIAHEGLPGSSAVQPLGSPGPLRVRSPGAAQMCPRPERSAGQSCCRLTCPRVGVLGGLPVSEGIN